MLEDDALAEGASTPSRLALPPTSLALGARRGDRRLSLRGRRLFPGPRRRSGRYPRPRARASDGADPAATMPAARSSRARTSRRRAFLAADWTTRRRHRAGRRLAASHVAMLARARGVPMVVGLGPLSWIGRHRHWRWSTAMPASWSSTPSRKRAACSSTAWRLRMPREPPPMPAASSLPCTADGRPIAVLLNVAASGRPRGSRSRDLRRHRPDAHRISVRGGPRAARRGNAICGLSTHCSTGPREGR